MRTVHRCVSLNLGLYLLSLLARGGTAATVLSRTMVSTIMGYISIGVILGFYGDYSGIMEKKMETTIMGYISIGVILRLYGDCSGIMEKKMETTIMGYISIG